MASLHKPPSDEKNHKIDNLIRNFCHTPLRTPPYMCEFNPIELIWAQIKFFIRSRNTSGEFTLKILNGITIEAINSITSDDWWKVIGHVIKIEDNYWEKDRQIQEQITINLGEESDSDDFSDSSDDCNGSFDEN
nr:unnamed protein product [Callosobruchus chinensis]